MEEPRSKAVQELVDLIERGEYAALDACLEPLHSADIADMLALLDNREKVVVLKRIGIERAADVLAVIDEKSGQALLELFTDSEVVSLFEEMPSDDAADFIASLPPEKSKQINALLPTVEREKLKELLGFEEDTAGGIMAVEKIAIPDFATIKDAIDLVRSLAGEIEDVQNIYVVDGNGKLVGSLPMLELLLHDSGTKISEVMNRNFIGVPVDMDQEDVAALFGRYDEVSLPVVDKSGVLVGRITVDDIIDVIEEEASEDITKIAGTAEEEIGETSPLRISRARLPWLVVGMLGETLNAIIMSRFEVPIQTVVTLAFFIPLVIGTAGNTGSQAAVVVVREIALGRSDVMRMGKRVFKELQVTFLNGVVLGVILFTIVHFWRHEPGLGLLLWVSLVSVTLVAALMGASVPLVFHRLKIDPAIASGPFITVSNDIIGLSIYLSMATYYVSMINR